MKLISLGFAEETISTALSEMGGQCLDFSTFEEYVHFGTRLLGTPMQQRDQMAAISCAAGSSSEAQAEINTPSISTPVRAWMLDTPTRTTIVSPDGLREDTKASASMAKRASSQRLKPIRATANEGVSEMQHVQRATALAQSHVTTTISLVGQEANTEQVWCKDDDELKSSIDSKHTEAGEPVKV